MPREFLALTVAALAAMAAIAGASAAERQPRRGAGLARSASPSDSSLGDGWYLRGATDASAPNASVAGQPPGTVFGGLAIPSSGFARRTPSVRLSADLSP